MSTTDVLTAAGSDPQVLVGKAFRLSDHYEVGREKIREFARATHNTHPAHFHEDAARALGHRGLLAPLTFTAILGGIAQHVIFTEFIPDYDLSQVLHTDQRTRAHRPLRAGDRLSTVICLEQFQSRHGQDSFVFCTQFLDHDDTPVQTSWTHAVARSAEDTSIDDSIIQAAETVMMTDTSPTLHRRITTASPPIRRSHSDADSAAEAMRIPHGRSHFHDLAVGDQLPATTQRLTRGDLVNYAGVAGDPNPIHWNDSVAGLAGLDGVVAHGMLTLSLCNGYLTRWTGDPTAVTDIDVRFTSPVFLTNDEPAHIEFTGVVRKLDPDRRTATIALTARAAGKRIFGRAIATATLN